MRFNVLCPPKRIDAGKLRKVRIVPRAKKSYGGEQKKNPESRGGVAPGASKRLREIASKEVTDAPAALGVSPLNTAMSANYQAVEIVHQTRVARFGARNGQVGSSPPVNAPQLSHLFTMQTP